MSTNDVCSGVSERNRVISPIVDTPRTGQKRSSNRTKTLRVAMRKFRMANALTARSSSPTLSAGELNEHVLEVGLADLDASHDDPVGVQRVEHLREPLLGDVHRAFDEAAGLDAAEHARQAREPAATRRLQAKRDDVADPDLALE